MRYFKVSINNAVGTMALNDDEQSPDYGSVTYYNESGFKIEPSIGTSVSVMENLELAPLEIQ